MGKGEMKKLIRIGGERNYEGRGDGRGRRMREKGQLKDTKNELGN